MEEKALLEMIEGVRDGVITADEAMAQLRRLPFADLGFARIDHHRSLRQGVAEAVYGPGKTAEQCAAIVAELVAMTSGPVVLTRANDEQIATSMAQTPNGTVTDSTVVWRPAPPRHERILVVTAGTADLPVARECESVLGAYGITPHRVTDVGVAGVHRLLAELDQLAKADVIVVIAGMEGALASVVGGIAAAPVVAVPTSAGYGAALEGVTALLGMMASCAAGITVVGIDNGFGAACAVARILDVRAKHG